MLLIREIAHAAGIEEARNATDAKIRDIEASLSRQLAAEDEAFAAKVLLKSVPLRSMFNQVAFFQHNSFLEPLVLRALSFYEAVVRVVSIAKCS